MAHLLGERPGDPGAHIRLAAEADLGAVLLPPALGDFVLQQAHLGAVGGGRAGSVARDDTGRRVMGGKRSRWFLFATCLLAHEGSEGRPISLKQVRSGFNWKVGRHGDAHAWGGFHGVMKSQHPSWVSSTGHSQRCGQGSWWLVVCTASLPLGMRRSAQRRGGATACRSGSRAGAAAQSARWPCRATVQGSCPFMQ